MRKQCATIDESVLGKQYLGLFQLTEDDQQGGLRFEMDKRRIGIRLTVPYSPERRAVFSRRAKGRGIVARNKAQG